MNPALSLIMPVWNGEEHLSVAIESLLRQTFEDFELLILDDGSTDRSLDIARSFGDRRLRILSLEHAGIVHALNTGVNEARAEIIARMDCDDRAHPERLQRQMAAFGRIPGASFCHTDIRLTGETRYLTRTPALPRTRALLAAQLCYRNPVCHPTVLFSKAAFSRAGGYWESERHAEDFGLFGRLIEQGPAIGLQDKLLDFRVHSASISKTKHDLQLALTNGIAEKHCTEFMGLPADRSVKVRQALDETGLRAWCTVAVPALLRLRWQSGELYAWMARQTARRLLRKS